MSFHVSEGDAKIMGFDVVNGSKGDIIVIGQSNGGEEVGVVNPFVHPLDEAFVVTVEEEVGKRVVVWVLLLEVSVDDGCGMDRVEETISFGAKRLEGGELSGNDSTARSDQSAGRSANAIGEGSGLTVAAVRDDEPRVEVEEEFSGGWIEGLKGQGLGDNCCKGGRFGLAGNGRV